MDWWTRRHEPWIDVTDVHRKRQIAEAEYQHHADAESKVLRVSGKTTPPNQLVSGLIARERIRQ